MKESKAWVMAAFALLGAHVSYGDVRTINYEASSEHTIAIDAALVLDVSMSGLFILYR